MRSITKRRAFRCAALAPACVAAFASAAFTVCGSREAAASPSTTTIPRGFEYGEVQHPRTVGLAGAGEVWGGSTTAVFENPANLTLYRVYHIEGLAAFSPEARRQSYGGGVVDSSTSRLAGGFGGTWSSLDPDGIKRQWTDLRLTLAYPISDRISLGATGRYFRGSEAVNRGPFGTSLASSGHPGDPIVNQFTFDAGAAIAITEQLRFAVSGHNLTAPGTSLMPIWTGAGIGWSNQIVSAEVDSQIDFTTFDAARARIGGGGEILLADHVPLRGGYRYDAGQKNHTLGLGAGYVERRFSIDVGASHDVGVDHPGTMISVGIRIFIDSGNATGGPGESSPDAF
jgi:hypothetical protein